jgi:TolA-binding protein
MYKRENKGLIWVVLVTIFLVFMGIIVYLVWSKNGQNEQSNYKEEVQRLQIQLSLLKSQISSLSDTNKKVQLESKVSFLEKYVSELDEQKSYDELTVKSLEKEIEKLRKKLEDEKPDEDPGPGRNKEGKFFFCGTGTDSNSNENYMFDEYEEGRDRMISVDKNHPLIKQLLGEGKLKLGEKFIIRYGKVDKDFTKISFFFNKGNEELEIIEE